MKKELISIVGLLLMTICLCSGIARADLYDGLVAYYPFDGDAHDESGNGNNGIIYGATLTKDRFGNANSAYSFNGIDNYISVKDNSSLDLVDELTITGWIYQNNAQADGGYRIVDKGTAGEPDGYTLDTYNHESGTGRRLRLCGSIACLEASTDYSLKSWHFIAVVVHNGQVTFYLDGRNDGAANFSSLNVNDLDLYIGRAHPGCGGQCGLTHFFNGMIDDIRIYNRALMEEEIQQLYGGNICTLAFSELFPVKGGSGVIRVTASSAECSNWKATKDVPWIYIRTKKLTKTGDVSYTISANTTKKDRIGTITIGDQKTTILQSGK